MKFVREVPVAAWASKVETFDDHVFIWAMGNTSDTPDFAIKVIANSAGGQ